MDSKQQTLMWQQNQYISDSGIHSGINTGGPPSLNGNRGMDDVDMASGSLGGELDIPHMMFDLNAGFGPGFTQEQVDGARRSIISNPLKSK